MHHAFNAAFCAATSAPMPCSARSIIAVIAARVNGAPVLDLDYL